MNAGDVKTGIVSRYATSVDDPLVKASLMVPLPTSDVDTPAVGGSGCSVTVANLTWKDASPQSDPMEFTPLWGRGGR